jgi:hypothetical protein
MAPRQRQLQVDDAGKKRKTRKGYRLEPEIRSGRSFATTTARTDDKLSARHRLCSVRIE